MTIYIDEYRKRQLPANAFQRLSVLRNMLSHTRLGNRKSGRVVDGSSLENWRT
jgi:hypothetical protein